MSTRERIVDEALTLFSTKGYAGDHRQRHSEGRGHQGCVALQALSQQTCHI